MFLLYLDASGTPEQQDWNNRHFVHIGLGLHEADWFDLDRQLTALTRKYAFPGQPFELHVKQFAVGITEHGRVPGFDRLSRADRREQVLAVRRQLRAYPRSFTLRSEGAARGIHWPHM